MSNITKNRKKYRSRKDICGSLLSFPVIIYMIMDLRLRKICQCQTPAFVALEMSAFEVRRMFHSPIAPGIQW